MHFPKFWAQGSVANAVCWQWSDLSVSDAQRKADESARKLAQRTAQKISIPKQQYWYGDRLLREPVLQEFRGSRGEIFAALTRNGYGVTVLNTAQVFFADVDLPSPALQSSGGLARFLRLLTGQRTLQAAGSDEPAVVEKVRAACKSFTSWGWRIYRTKAGLRIMATHELLTPESSDTQRAFSALSTDPLYRRLCKAQESFRARLTPKPWRCGVPQPPERWPFVTPEAQKRFESWLPRYEGAAARFATCSLIECCGCSTVHPDIAPIIKLHDESCRCGAGLPLA